MREEQIRPAGIPAKLYDPSDGTAPLLLLGHGGGGSKDAEPFVTLGRDLAEGTSLRVVCIDAVGHGERSTGEDVRTTMGSERSSTQMIADWRAVTDDLGGNAVAYVGYSMGMLYGAPTVAAMPELKAAVFGVGGIPAEVMRERLLDVARRLEHPQVLMINMTKDETFPVAGVHEFFDAIPGRKKRLMFWEGNHVGLPAESTRHTIAFLNRYAIVSASVFDGALSGDRILPGDANDDYTHDEALGGVPVVPLAVLLPETTDEVAAIVRLCDEQRIPVTARGSGTGLSGAAIPVDGGVVISFERMKRIEVDEENQVAIVEPGVTLAELDEVTAKHDLVYPVFPGEYSASLGGNVATNAGGMRAVKYGVTRHQVLGLEAVLPTGEVIRTGGRFVKGSTGYDLTQLIIGSEGTLAVVTEALLRLYPRAAHQSTVLAPFRTLDEVMHAVPRVVASGIGPMIVEYIDVLTMGGMTRRFNLELGVPEDVQQQTLAYLVIVMENRSEVRLEEDVVELAEHLTELGAIDVFVLPGAAGQRLIEAREKAFWLAKEAGADDIIDIVVPRAAIADFFVSVGRIAEETGTFVAGCGHAGDGNVHLSIYKPDAEERSAVLRRLFEAGMALGGVISGEHGIGLTKRKYFLALEDPVKIDLMRRIKAAFDPNGILNPGTLL